jgi:hypothetical protein
MLTGRETTRRVWRNDWRNSMSRFRSWSPFGRNRPKPDERTLLADVRLHRDASTGVEGPLGWLDRLAEVDGWATVEGRVLADGTVEFWEVPSKSAAITLGHEGDANRSGDEGQGSLGGEPASQLGEDRQVGVEPGGVSANARKAALEFGRQGARSSAHGRQKLCASLLSVASRSLADS